jgi:hypothetical protein
MFHSMSPQAISCLSHRASRETWSESPDLTPQQSSLIIQNNRQNVPYWDTMAGERREGRGQVDQCIKYSSDTLYRKRVLVWDWTNYTLLIQDFHIIQLCLFTAGSDGSALREIPREESAVVTVCDWSLIKQTQPRRFCRVWHEASFVHLLLNIAKWRWVIITWLHMNSQMHFISTSLHGPR